MRHAVIMAGGAGTRLWPLSRSDRPKQLLRLFGGKSLLREAYERVASILPPEFIYVISGDVHLPLIAEELPELAGDNLFGEPVGRDTANAVGLAAAILHHRDPDGVMGIFTADHLIKPVKCFGEAVDRAFSVADQHPHALVTLGVRPASAHTGYGYVRRGAPLDVPGAFNVEEFTEKPDLITARRYLASGDYYWNSGTFTWRLSAILEQLRQHLPASSHGLAEITDAWDTPVRADRLAAIYPTLQKISIDFAVMERAPEVLMVEMDCEWADVGSWTALEQVLDTDSHGNIEVGPQVVNLGSKGTIIVSEDDHLIATLGVSDLVIVRSRDATLICKKRDAQGIKELVEKIRARYGDRYA